MHAMAIIHGVEILRAEAKANRGRSWVEIGINGSGTDDLLLYFCDPELAKRVAAAINRAVEAHEVARLGEPADAA